jgi:uncharacterized protein (TIRG00374 family)
MFTISDRAIQNFEKAFGVAGLFISAWMIYRLGPQRIAENLHTVGWGVFLIILTRALHYLFETAAWKLVLAERGRGLSFFRLLIILLQGESLNYITVTKVGGEALKAYAIRQRTGLALSAASVIVLKFCTLVGFWIVIFGGFLAILFNAAVEPKVKGAVGVGLVAVTLLILTLSWIQKIGLSGPLSWIIRPLELRWKQLSGFALRLARVDRHIVEMYRSGGLRVGVATLLCVLSWIEEIVAVWVLLQFFGMPESWFIPTLIATTALLLNSLFFFVPWKAGTQEGTMVLTFTILGLSEPLGLSIAILRRLRELFWVFLGLVLFSIESLTTSGYDQPAEGGAK